MKSKLEAALNQQAEALGLAERTFSENNKLDIITWKTFIKIPLFDVFSLGANTFCFKFLNLGNMVFFFFFCLKGSVIKSHAHDCDEHAFTLYGKFLNKGFYHKNPAGTYHFFTAIRTTLGFCMMTKPKLK
jgi:hypothetical protein